MGLGNFIKRQAGIGKLPKNQLNQTTVLNIFKNGAPFIVVLPSYETIRNNSSSSISKSMGGGYRVTAYYRPPSLKHKKEILTNVSCTFEQLTIQHAQSNGKHIFININQIARYSKLNDRVMIELVDGIQYTFIMNKDIQNQWKTIGFNPQFVIDIFCNIVNGAYLNNIIKKQQRLDEKQQLYKKEQEQLKKEDRIDAERFERIAKQNKQKEIEEENKLKNEFNEFATKIRKLKEVYEVGGISQEEYIELKENFIYEIKSLPLPKDIDPLSKIKEAKELLDDNDITQEEFEIIKTKYIEIL